MPCGRKRKKHKIATHKRKKKLRAMRHKQKYSCLIKMPLVNVSVAFFIAPPVLLYR